VSKSSQGPGWWQASDGKWYPPSATPGAYVPPTNPMPPVNRPHPTLPVAHEGRGPWRRFRSLPMVLQMVCWAVAGLMLLGAIGAATGGSKKPTKTIGASLPTAGTSAAKAAPPTAVPTSAATTTSTTVARTTVVPTTVAPTTTQPPTTPPTPLPTAAPATQAPIVTPPSIAPPAGTVSCHPLTNGGKCYEPGEHCRNADHGVHGVAGNGDAIICEYNNGWRWDPTSP
jgi:hypothetical protein